MRYPVKIKFKFKCYHLFILLLLFIKSEAASRAKQKSAPIAKQAETVHCPIGFSYTDIKPAETSCIQIKSQETFFDKYERCSGNIVSLDFFRTDYQLPETREFPQGTTRFWTDYIRAYENGPFINWRYGDENMGRPLIDIRVWDEDGKDGSDMCSTVDIVTKKMKVSNCNERHARMCVINTYERADPILWNCPQGYISFSDPVPSCVIAPTDDLPNARNVALRATLTQSAAFCKRKEGNLLHRGYIYSNHPEFAKEQEISWELPLGIRKEGDELFWMNYDLSRGNESIPRSEWNFDPSMNVSKTAQYVSLKNSKWILRESQQTFYYVLCEYFVNLPLLEIHVQAVSGHQLRVTTNVDTIGLSDIWCFTDSVAYFPTRISLSETNVTGMFSITPIHDGYYWCVSINTKEYITHESKKTLYIGNKERAKSLHAVMLHFHLNTEPNLTAEFLNFIQEELNVHFTSLMKTYYSSEDVGYIVTNSNVKRVYDGRRILLHSNINSTGPFDSVSLQFFDILYIRNVLTCPSVGLLPESEIGEEFVSDDNCVLSQCLGDFNIGAYWKNILTMSPLCVTTTTLLPTTTTEMTTTTTTMMTTVVETTTMITTTTPANPTDQVNEVANNIQNLVNGTVNSTQLADATNQINSILSFEEEVEIPDSIVADLETIVQKINLGENETHVKVVEANIAVVVTDISKDSQIYGIKLDNYDEDGFTDDSLQLLTNGGRPTPITSKTDLIVNIPPSLGLGNESKVSFVVFRNDKAFDHNTSREMQRVNSRIISITITNMSSFAEGQYIDILLRPRDGINDNETKQCAYWNFQTGSKGNWSTDGCKLLKEKSPDGLDICRCYHLTHFAEIIRFGGTPIGDLDKQILTIISFVGCALSLIGLLLIGLTGAVFKSWRSDFSNKIWMHLSGAIAILVLTFMVIAFKTFGADNGVSCVVAGVLLHYSVLASFVWMLISAVLSYRRLVTVFAKNSSHRLLKACILGWLVPMIPIGILFAVDPDNYSQHIKMGTLQTKFCYPSGLGFWLSVFLPVALIVVANCILFSIIIYSVFISSKIKRHGDSKQLFRSISVSFLLFFLFGLTWIFGLLSEQIIFTYLFCLTATLQGLVLFLFFVVGNKKTRDLWLIKLHLKEKKKVPMTSTMSRSYGSRQMTTSTSNGKRMHINRYDEGYISKPRSLSGTFDHSDRFS